MDSFGLEARRHCPMPSSRDTHTLSPQSDREHTQPQHVLRNTLFRTQKRLATKPFLGGMGTAVSAGVTHSSLTAIPSRMHRISFDLRS